MVLSVLVFKSLPIFPQTANDTFISYTTKQGLSSNITKCVLKDSKGFMWIGTKEGLSRFDGYGFKKFYSLKGDPNTLSDNNVSCITEDHDGNLWIGTPNGLNMYNRQTGKFTQFHVNYLQSNSLVYNEVNCILVDKAGTIWIGTSYGLSRYNTRTRKFTNYHHDSKNTNSISSDAILSIAGNGNGNILIGTFDGGVNELNPKTNIISREINAKLISKGLANYITGLFVDGEGIIWMGTFDSGLIKYDPVTKEASSYFNQNPRVAPSNISHIISMDKENLWVAAEQGLFLLTKKTKRWVLKERRTCDGLYQEDGARLWVCSSLAGLLQMNFNQLKFQTILTQTIFPGLNSPHLSALKEIGNLLLFGAGDGMKVYNKVTGVSRTYSKSKDPNGIWSNYVHKIVVDSKKKIWILTDKGINEFDVRTGKFSRILKEVFYFDMLEIGEGKYWLACDGGVFFYDDHTKKIGPIQAEYLGENRVRSFVKDSGNNVWVGTVNGLNLYNKSTNEFTNFYSDLNKPGAISNNEIISLYEDSNKRLWVCTANGLNKYNPRDSTFDVYDASRGLNANYIKSCIEDNLGNLWISTSAGISRLTKQGTINNYDERDGFLIVPHVAINATSGELVVAGDKGFVVFDPATIKNNLVLPKVYVTDFTLFNKPVPVTEKGILTKEISSASEINLSYKESVFTFSFAALNYLLPEKNQYAYKMEGFDKSWNYVGDKRSATYTNLDPGEYIFKVKASNNDGVWNEKGTSIKVIITPPYWATWWFRTLAAFTILAFAYGFYRYRMKQIKLQRTQLEHQIELRTAEILQQSNELKEQAENLQAVNEELEAQSEELQVMNEELQEERTKSDKANNAKTTFLATMSHEIRSPMNGMIGMASLLARTPLTDEQSHYVDIIKSSGDNLVTVINDILDFSKIESGRMELEHRSFNLFDCIEEVFNLFSEKVSPAVLELLYKINPDVPESIIGDSVRLRQIIMNLVGNAVKFTKAGEVFLLVSCIEKEEAEIELLFEVRDTGIGIAEKKLSSLFQPFIQADSSTTRKYGGSGLGLAISKRLVELMNGEIYAKSELGKGSSFFFSIQTTESFDEVTSHPEVAVLFGKRFLVVDDNASSRMILKSHLESWGIEAVALESGEKALSFLSENKDIDLVITDLHMPVMNGVQLAEIMKERQPKLCVILLNTVGDEYYKLNNQVFCGTVMKPVRRNDLRKMICSQFSDLQVINDNQTEPPMEEFSIAFSKKYPLEILVAEDNKVNQTLILSIMETVGYRVDIAANGNEAVAAVQKKKYDVVLMDMQMPEMDGLEATALIRRLKIEQPIIIALTANAMQGDRNMCLEAGMDDYMAKPLRFEKLVELLEKHAIQLQK